MKNVFDKFIIKIFNIYFKHQDKKHKKRMETLKKKILSGKIGSEAYHANSAATLSIKNNSDQEKKANQKKIKEIIEEALKSEDGLFKYIENSTTKIYKIKFANKILSLIDETEGFILPQKGLRALYLNIILNKKISFETKEMFVLRDYKVNVYAFIYQFYNWYCYKMNLSGYDYESQKQFKKVFQICETNRVNTLSFEEILELKMAIKRDIEAIDFVINFVKEHAKAKENLEKIKDGKKVNI